jgi:hypothetical protein
MTTIQQLVTSSEYTSLKTKDQKFDYLVDNGIKSSEVRLFLKTVGTKTVDQMSVMVTIFRTEPDRKSSIKKALEQTGYTESTINHFYNACAFAKEWTKQELDDLPTERLVPDVSVQPENQEPVQEEPVQDKPVEDTTKSKTRSKSK